MLKWSFRITAGYGYLYETPKFVDDKMFCESPGFKVILKRLQNRDQTI